MNFRNLLSLCAVALISVAVMAQAPTGKVHGRVTDPTGVPKAAGTIGLSTDGGKTFKFTFPVSATGDFTGDGVAPGTYSLIFKMPDTGEGKFIDLIDNVKVVAGQDTLQDVDMTRKEFMDKMTPDQRKQVEDFKKKNADVMKTNQLIKNLNADLQTARQDNKDKKYDEAEALMLKDTVAKPDGFLLWYELGSAQLGQKKYDDAIASYKKVLELDTKKPSPELDGGAHAGIGEAYARDGKPDDVANAVTEYDTAAKTNPAKAAFYLTNEAVVYQNVSNGDAQAAAADKAIAADEKNPLPYYLKGQALAAKITVDAKSGAYILPPGMVDAYKKYLELAPTGQYVAEVNAILAETTKQVSNSFKAQPTKKK
jgi:hypothetical protein